MTSRRPSPRRVRTGPVQASIYVRMSLDKTGAGLGVERQEKECRALCERNGWEVSEDRIFRDNDISATTGKRRPGFEALLESDPEVIVAWHTDRLVRLTKDLERVIELGVDVHAVTAGHVDLSNPAGRAVARTVTAWATYEGEQKAERQRASARQRAASGKAWWSARPFGFELDGTHRDDEAAALVRAYHDLLTGASLPTLARQLNESGHLTCRGKEWTATTLRPVLLNARNAAIRVYDGEEVGKAAWEPIIPEETWRAAVRLLTNPARRTGGGGGAPKHLLTGVATCGACGGSVKIGWRGRKGSPDGYPVYVCRKSSCVSLPAVMTEGYVVTELIRELQRPESRQEWRNLRQQSDEATKALRVEQATLRQRLDAVAEDFADGLMDRPQFRAATEKLRARLAEVEQQLTEAGEKADLADTMTVHHTLMTSFLALDPDVPDPENAPMDVDALRSLVSGFYERVELLPRGRGNRGWLPAPVRLTPRQPTTVSA